jgi:hypothetical protein
MLPAEHVVVAFLPALAYVLVRDGRLPRLHVVGLVLVGSLFPDLVDKPLAHQFGLLPSGRVFMHSLPVAVPFLAVVVLYGWRTDRVRPSSAFAFGHLSHLLADTHRALLGPTPRVPPDLLWPFTRPTPRSAVPHWAGAGGVNVRLWTVFSVVVLSVLLSVVLADVRARL